MRALGYDAGLVEWGVREGLPHALDSPKPAPELEPGTLTPKFVHRAVEHLAELVVKLAIAPGGATASRAGRRAFDRASLR